jgi:hypothetical protein
MIVEAAYAAICAASRLFIVFITAELCDSLWPEWRRVIESGNVPSPHLFAKPGILQ